MNKKETIIYEVLYAYWSKKDIVERALFLSGFKYKQVFLYCSIYEVQYKEKDKYRLDVIRRFFWRVDNGEFIGKNMVIRKIRKVDTLYI